jgi:hypothetical protein
MDDYEERRIFSMVKTQRTAMTLALGMLLVLFSTAFAAAPAQASVSRTAAAPPPSPQQLQAGWSGWGEVPGNGFTLSGPAPTFDQVNDYAFVRGTDNHLYVNAFNGTTWSGWRGVPGHGLTPSAPAATTSGTTVSLFVRGTDNRIYRNTLNGTTWSGWSQVPGNGLTSDTPNALANGTTLSLFVRGTDNRIYMNTFNGTTWSGWREVPGHELTLSGPTTNISTSTKGTFLNLFVRGTNNHLFVNTTFDGTTWSGWSEVPGNELTPSAPAATTLYLTGVPSNTLYLFVRGTDNKIYVNTFANGMTWSGWSQVLGNGLTPDAPGAVAGATSGTAGFVVLYVRGTNDRIYLNVLGVG